MDTASIKCRVFIWLYFGRMELRYPWSGSRDASVSRLLPAQSSQLSWVVPFLLAVPFAAAPFRGNEVNHAHLQGRIHMDWQLRSVPYGFDLGGLTPSMAKPVLRFSSWWLDHFER